MTNGILQWNVKGINARQCELSKIVEELNPSCMCLQEVKLSNDNSGYSVGRLYKAYTKLPINNQHPHGGSLIAIKTSISHDQIPLNTTLQAVAVTFPSGKLKSLCSIYLPPNDIITKEELKNLTDQLPKPTMIMGDFNAHNPLWYDENLDTRGKIIQDLIEEQNLVTINEDSPTFFRSYDQATSIIDLALVTSTSVDDFNWTIQDDLNGSDHFPILVSPLQHSPADTLEKWNLKHANWDNYRNLAMTKRKVNTIPSIEEAYLHLKNTIIEASTKSIPKIKINKIKRPRVPWWSPECKKEKSKVRSAFRTMRRNPNPTTIKTYRRRLAIKVRTFRQAKIKSWREYVSKLQAKTPTSQVWQKIRKINGKYIPKPLPYIKAAQNLITLPKEVADFFVDHYAFVSTPKEKHKLPPRLNHEKDCDNQSINHDFNMRELENSLKQLKEGKSAGEDEIENSMLKNLPPITKQYLLDLYNKMWNENSFPNDWKSSIILPILKPGKEPTNPKNYRPISLTSCICKLFESMVNNRLMWYLEGSKKLSSHQYGFRQGRTTIDPIAALTTDILNGYKDGKTTTAVFFDFEKAFDTISRNTIVNNLYQMGVHGRMLNFIFNYLRERSIKVRIGNTLSRSRTTLSGIPQGGVLSATCFLIAINSILDTLPRNIKGSLYADDLVIYHTSKKVRSSSRQLQNAIKKLENWANMTGLKFSSSKSEIVHFWRGIKGGTNQDFIPLTLYGNDIPRKETTKFLGMILDRKLSWKPHIQTLKGEAMRSLNVLRTVSKINYGPDRRTLLRLYWALCKSKIDYGSQIYSSAAPTTLEELNPVQNEALRICTGAFRSSPVPSLQVESGVPPLKIQRNEQCLRYITRLESFPEYKEKLIVLSDLYDSKYEKDKHHMAPVGTRCRDLKKGLTFTPDPLQSTIMDTPPWLLKTINFCTEGATDTKGGTPTPQLLQNFMAHMHKHLNTNHIYTDGSKSEKGVGFGIVYGQYLNNKVRGTLPIETSVFTAELYAIHKALLIIENSTPIRWTIFTDSQASLQAIAQQNPQHPLIKSIQTLLIQLQDQQKKVYFCKVPSHVGIIGNEMADRTANESQNVPGLYTTYVPQRDYHHSFRKYTMKKWQTYWDHLDDGVEEDRRNKLKIVKPNVKPWNNIPGRNRKYETKITRLRIGHTRLTNSYHMSRGRPPECIYCGTSPLTTKHLLIECRATKNIRDRLKLPSDLQRLLGEKCPVTSLIKYLIELNVLDDI